MSRKPLRLTPTGLVMVPLIVLTLVFVLIAIVVTLSDAIAFVSPTGLLVAGGLLYAATLLLLSRSGVSNLRELEAFSNADPMTRLPNRSRLLSQVDRLSKTDAEIAVALIDIDEFRQINDRYGHQFGDQAICKIAALMRNTFSDEATCFRLGGDEFVVMMHGRVAGTILEGMCRTLLTQLQRSIDVDDRSIPLGASIGLARSTAAERLTGSQLLRHADIAVETSKRTGKMRCTWYNDGLEKSRSSARKIEDSLRKAIEREELALVYQPVVDAKTGTIVAVEALLRWDRKDGQKVGPDVFIPVAEETGLIYPIGLWVLREAMEAAQNWPGIALSVNISAAQLRNPEFPIKLGEILEETGFPAHLLQLEVTETSLVHDPVIADRSLGIIRKFGVRIALDDFGTGYASIGFLRQFRFDKLKLDRSLVVEAGEDDGSRAMMVTSVVLARALNMEVTAEGVETAEQADLARLAGCDHIQGWLYFKAMSAGEIDALIAERSLDAPPKGAAA